MFKKALSVILSIILIATSFCSFMTALATETVVISTSEELAEALKSNDDVIYSLDANESYMATYSYDGCLNFGVKANVNIEGNNCTINTVINGNDSVIYQNDDVISRFNQINIVGRNKSDVGIWISAGSMTFENSRISDFKITNGRRAAIAVASSGKLTLNNTELSDNSDYDISLYDNATLNINGNTQLNYIRDCSKDSEISIGKNWSGEFSIFFDHPCNRTLGTVGEGADIGNIKVENSGYELVNDNGNLLLSSTGEKSIHFDLSQREQLYKGSTGFLYGEAEINVPSIDLLQGLKPDTMVQKALGGLQHPTGDATRTRSSLISAGVKDMQIYFQDMYLEWPYDAPMNNDSIDVESYKKSVEKIMYGMVCKQVDSSTNGAFLGNDGNYYVLDKSLASQYSYVLFNEPDQIWFAGRLSKLEEAWKCIYNAVRSIDPDARCVGPNYAGFSASDYENFLKYCKSNNCLPQLISWHELGDISLTDFYKHYDTVESLVSKYYSSCSYKPQLIVNEYARHYDIGSVGGLVKWLAMFEDKNMSGCLAYWAMANSLNELAADQNSPTSSWWVYHWYAQMTGKQCPMIYPEFKDTRFYGVTSYDEEINMAYCLFGGSEDISATETVYLENLSSTNLANSNGDVQVKLYAVSFSGQQGACYKPECVFDGVIKSEDNTVKLQTSDTDEMDAFFAIITRPDDNAVSEDMNNVKVSTLSYEAENALLLGDATVYSKTGWTEFATSGRADVGSINKNGDGVEFTVTVSEDGLYNASLFYSLQSPFVNPQTLEPDPSGQNRGIGKTLPFGISVDGKRLDNIYLESTILWLYKNHCDVELELNAGTHTITFTHINGDERNKGNLQLVAALDKLDLTRIYSSSKNDFEIDLTQMSNFKTADGYKVTAVASEAGYYRIVADNDVSLSKQAIDYASDAKTYSEVTTYDIPVANVFYLSKGANTINVIGTATKLEFFFDSEKTNSSSTVINADEITLHGNNPVYKDNPYANSGRVISEIGVGQTVAGNDTGDKNYAIFKVNASEEGIYNLAIRYSNDEPAPVMLKSNGDTYIHPYNIDLVERYAQISVNNEEPETVYFRNTYSWDTFKTIDVQIKLKSGENTIKIYNDNSYQFSELVNSTAPEIDTVTISSLSYCESRVEKIAKTANQQHSFGAWRITAESTCVNQGTETATCSECGYEINRSLPVLSHNYSIQAVVAPTCTEQGYSVYRCSGCGSSYNSDYLNANGHSFATNNKTCSVCNTVNPNYKAPVTKLKATSISKLKAGKKQFKVTWKKTSSVTGYKIQYSTSKKFTKKTTKTLTVKGYKKTSATIKKLKSGKKYYVRIRTYKGSNYSSWSKVKSIKVK